MDEEIDIINTNTRNEKIKNFFINNRKSLIGVLVVIILALCGYFFYEEFQTRQKAKLADQYNLAVIKYESGQKDIANELLTILKSKRDELVFKLKLTSKDEFEVLSKRVENLEKKIEKLQLKKRKKSKSVKKS